MLMCLYLGVISFVVTSDISFCVPSMGVGPQLKVKATLSRYGASGSPINFGLIQIYFGILFRTMEVLTKGPSLRLLSN